MPGTEIAIREADYWTKNVVNYDFYLGRSIEWAFSLCGWLLGSEFDRTYALAHPNVIKTCWDALQRNLKWQEEAKEIEAAEAYQKFMREGKLHGDDLAKIDRHQETAELLWEEVARNSESSEFEPEMTVEEVSSMLADTLFGVEASGFRINIVTSGDDGDEINAYLSVSFPELKHHDRIIQRNGHGEWEDYPA
jgi:hypothetical protein